MFRFLRRTIPVAVAVVVATALTLGLTRARSASASRALLARGGSDLTRSIRGAAEAVLANQAPEVSPSSGGLAAPAPPVVSEGEGYLGVILARSSADVAPRFDGRLATVNVRVGDTVSRGTILATIAVPTLSYDLRVAEAELRAADLEVDRANTELSQATERFARKQRLDEEHLALADEVKGADYQCRLAETHLSSARTMASERRAQLERLRRDDEDTRIIAPFEGVVAARYAEPGTSVHALVPVLRLITMSDLLARFAVPQADVERLPIGGRLRIETAQTHRVLDGKVERVASEVEPASHMVFVEAQVEANIASNSVPSGELARVRLAAKKP